MKKDKENEHSIHLTDHIAKGKEHDENCIFCRADNGDGITTAYIELVGQEYANKDNMDEIYQGEFSSDEEFAKDMAEQTGDIKSNDAWPLYCIDWEWAASELMMDYSEVKGHYFRNL